jgi:hypothetical protein
MINSLDSLGHISISSLDDLKVGEISNLPFKVIFAIDRSKIAFSNVIRLPFFFMFRLIDFIFVPDKSPRIGKDGIFGIFPPAMEIVNPPFSTGFSLSDNIKLISVFKDFAFSKRSSVSKTKENASNCVITFPL